MYYAIDDNGHIVMDENSEILPDLYQELYPDSATDLPVSDAQGQEVQPDFVQDIVQSNSVEDQAMDSPDFETQSSNGSSVSPGVTYNITAGPEFDYDELYNLLSAIPGYNVYPNQTAVNVFEYVLNGLEDDVGYVIISGSDTYTTYLYYSSSYSVSGNSLHLGGDVTVCRMYQYRPSSSSAWQYTYSVAQTGDIEFNPTTQLVYTNLIEGYPDVIPYKQKESYSLLWSIPLFIIAIAASAKFAVRRRQ